VCSAAYGKLPMIKRCYQLLGVWVTIDTDSEEFFSVFDGDFSWFAGNPTNVEGPLSVCVSLPKNGNRRCLRIGDQAIDLGGYPSPVGFAYQRTVREILEAARDFVVLHAGVVARDDQAVVISGPPGAGKTTLVLHLLQNRFAFLSDDFCPIETATRLVHPFPRSVLITRSVSPNDSNGPSCSSFRPHKFAVNPGSLPATVCCHPCRPRWLICLEPGDTKTVYHDLHIRFAQPDASELLTSLQNLGGVEATTLDWPAYWRFRYRKDAILTPTIKPLLDRHGDEILEIYTADRVHPDFDLEPDLVSIPPHEAALRMLSQGKQEIGATLDINGSSSSKPGARFLQLTELLEGINCYRLSVGRLEAQQRLLLELVTAEGEL
jgi:hypothetical protein